MSIHNRWPPSRPELKEASEDFLPSGEEYTTFTNDSALLLKGWIEGYHQVHESEAKKRCWQIRCIGDNGDGVHKGLRVLVVNGSTNMFALTKYVAEAFSWRPLGKRYDPQPSKGVLPAGSHWTVNVPGTKSAGIIGSQKSAFKAAGRGAPFFPEKKVKVFQLLRRRSDVIVYHCNEGRVTVRLDGCTNSSDFGKGYMYTPRCVGADDTLYKFTWTNLNARYLENKPGESLLHASSMTEEEVDEMIDNHYKTPLFDNRGNLFPTGLSRTLRTEEMLRAVALPFRDEE